jgi:hypothetical protein
MSKLWSIKTLADQKLRPRSTFGSTVKIWVHYQKKYKPIYKIWVKKPQKKQKNGITLELDWLVYRLSNLSQKSCFNWFPRIETKIGKRWKFETYQKEQRAVKKLNTDLLSGMSHNFDGLKQTTLQRIQSKISRHGYLLILRACVSRENIRAQRLKSGRNFDVDSSDAKRSRLKHFHDRSLLD